MYDSGDKAFSPKNQQRQQPFTQTVYEVPVKQVNAAKTNQVLRMIKKQ
jgi:hypothetical protein